jgi:hypothetical protein
MGQLPIAKGKKCRVNLSMTGKFDPLHEREECIRLAWKNC